MGDLYDCEFDSAAKQLKRAQIEFATLRAENERLRAELANAEAKQWDGTTGPSIAGTMIVLEGADAIAKRDATIAELRGLCREADYALQMEMSRCSAVDHAENACGDCGTRHELAKRLREAGKGGEDGT